MVVQFKHIKYPMLFQRKLCVCCVCCCETDPTVKISHQLTHPLHSKKNVLAVIILHQFQHRPYQPFLFQFRLFSSARIQFPV